MSKVTRRPASPRKAKLRLVGAIQVSTPSDIAPAAIIIMSMVARITTITGMLVGTPRPTTG